MKNFIFALSIVFISFPAYSFEVNKELNQAFVCDGYLKANAVLDYESENDDKSVFSQKIKDITTAGLLISYPLLMEDKVSREDFARYEAVSANAYNIIYQAALNQTWNSDHYELILECHNQLLRTSIKKSWLFKSKSFVEFDKKTGERVLSNILKVLE